MFRRDFLSKVTFGLYAGSILGPKNLASTNSDKSLRDMLEESELLKFWNTRIYFNPTKEEKKYMRRQAYIAPVTIKMVGETNQEKYNNIVKDINGLIISQVNSSCGPSRYCMDQTRTILIINDDKYGLCAYNTANSEHK